MRLRWSCWSLDKGLSLSSWQTQYETKLSRMSHPQEQEALVDTGAQCTLMPSDFKGSESICISGVNDTSGRGVPRAECIGGWSEPHWAGVAEAPHCDWPWDSVLPWHRLSQERVFQGPERSILLPTPGVGRGDRATMWSFVAKIITLCYVKVCLAAVYMCIRAWTQGVGCYWFLFWKVYSKWMPNGTKLISNRKRMLWKVTLSFYSVYSLTICVQIWKYFHIEKKL